MRTRHCSALAVVIYAVCTTGCLDRELKALNPCLVSSVSRKVEVNNIDKVDLLFMVDNSNSMAEEQAALKQQFPKMIQVLTTGMRTVNDPNPFSPARDLHLGVVSSDMGAFGQMNVQGCNIDGGDDGRLKHVSTDGAGCQAAYPSFLTYTAPVNGPPTANIATDFGCIAELGTGGCGYEQQMEASFKALWPATYADAMGNVVMPNPYTFIGPITTGRGDLQPPDGAAGFVRTATNGGISLLAITVVTDEEDCSSQVTDHFRVASGPNDPLAQQGPQVRCLDNPQNLYPTSRYIDGFKALRAGFDKLVVFAAIVGVPTNLVDEKARAAVDFSDDATRDAYYDKILADPAMQERVQGRGQSAQLTPSCMRTDRTGRPSTATPPRRIVDVVKGFGQNGVLQSICQDDFGPAMDAIIEVIARQLGAVCLPRPLVRRSDGLVGCNVVWELPPVTSAPEGTPTECNQMPFLKTVDTGSEPTNDRGGANCKVNQLAVSSLNTAPSGAGWYYDDFSAGVMQSCPDDQRQRVSFTGAAKPNTGVVVKLECLNETQRLPYLVKDLSTDVAQPDIGSACNNVVIGGETVSGDAACIVTLTSGTDKTALFCHPDQNVCVKSCQSSSDCPPAWECDTRTVTTLVTNGRPYCVNPTCGTQ
jgi:hypothetical protein